MLGASEERPSGDCVRLQGLAARGHHGWLEAETELGQVFTVDLALYLDLHPAGSRDDLAATVDYAAVAGEVIGIVEGEPVRLIETLAERIAGACLARPAVEGVEVTVHKPQAPVPVPFADVSVTIRRDRT